MLHLDFGKPNHFKKMHNTHEFKLKLLTMEMKKKKSLQELKMKFLKMRNSKYQEIRDVVGHVVTIIKTTEQCTFRDETFLNEIGFEVARIYQHVDTVGTIESEINRLIASKNLAFFAENLLSNTLKRIEKNNVLETL